MLKYRLNDGETVWESNVVNGGYGTSSVVKNIVLILKEFNGIAAFNKIDGTLLWEFSGEDRIRSSINIIDDNIVFSCGGDIYFLM